MFDYCKASSTTLSPSVWLDNSALPFTVQIVEQTGEVCDQNRTYDHEGLTFRLAVSRDHPEGLRPILQGSFHRYRNYGKHNADDFGLADLQAVFRLLADRYGLDPVAFDLQSLEIGVNLALPPGLTVAHVLASIVSHRNKRFTQMRIGKQRQSIGLQCQRSDYHIKVYNKGKQAGVTGREVLRVEVKVVKMRALERFEIRTLANLINPVKVEPLGKWLASFVADLVFIEPGSIDESQLSPNELSSYKDWRNPLMWETWPRQKRSRQKARFHAFLERYANSTLQNDLCAAIIETWEYLTHWKQEKGRRFHRLPESSEAGELYTFSPLVWRVKTSHRQGGNHSPNHSPNFSQKNGRSYPQSRTDRIHKRQCISCGRNISHQKKGSLFCSEKARGKAAKACRNVDSNRRRTLTRRIMKAQAQNGWLLISYQENGQSYADTLHASEVVAGGDWLNLVESVKLLDEQPPKVLTGSEARQLMERLTKANAEQTAQA